MRVYTVNELAVMGKMMKDVHREAMMSHADSLSTYMGHQCLCTNHADIPSEGIAHSFGTRH